MNEKKVKSKFVIILLSILVSSLFILILMFFYGNQINTRTLTSRVHNITDSNIPPSLNDLNIIFFSDIEIDAFNNERLLEKFAHDLSSFEVDLLIFGGDLFSSSVSEISLEQEQQITSTLMSVRSTYGKFAVLGENDLQNPKVEETTRRILKNAGFEILDNSTRRIYTTTNHEYIYLTGLSPLSSDGFDPKQAFNDVNADTFHIVAIHEPDSILELDSFDFDLQLSGHTHGGQINLPFIDPIVNKQYGQKFLSGSNYHDNKQLIVSEGIGLEKVHFRLFTRNSYLHINLFS